MPIIQSSYISFSYVLGYDISKVPIIQSSYVRRNLIKRCDRLAFFCRGAVCVRSPTRFLGAVADTSNPHNRHNRPLYGRGDRPPACVTPLVEWVLKWALPAEGGNPSAYVFRVDDGIRTRDTQIHNLVP